MLGGERVETTSSMYSVQPLTLLSRNVQKLHLSVLRSQNAALHCPQVKQSGQLCVAKGDGLWDWATSPTKPHAADAQWLHHSAAVWGRNYRRMARCERSFFFTDAALMAQ